MELKDKIDKIEAGILPSKIISEVRSNLSDIKRSIGRVKKTDKEFILNNFKYGKFKSYITSEDGSTIEDCLLSEHAIANHLKDGFQATGGRANKSIDFYSFYFEDDIAYWKDLILNIANGNSSDIIDKITSTKKEVLITQSRNFKPIAIGLSLFLLIALIIAYIPFKTEPYFDINDTNYKILILPFKKQCEYDGSLENVGYVIEKRLMELSNKDSLNLNVKYISNFTEERLEEDLDYTNFYNRVMKENNADHIIYGDTREENCSTSESDEICINYLVSNKNAPNEVIGNPYSTFQKASVPDISDGKLQGQIDMIIYMQAASIIELINPYQALAYFDKIIDSDFQSVESILFMRTKKIDILSRLGIYEGVIEECNFFLANSDNKIAAPFEIFCTSLVKDIPIIEVTQPILEENPNDVFANIHNAEYYLHSDLQKANQYFETAIKHCTDKNVKTALVSMYANLLNSYHYYQETIYYSSKRLEEVPNDFSLLMYRGMAFLATDLDKAEIDFKNALLIFPNSSNAHLKLSLTYLFMSNEFKFNTHYIKAIELDPNNPYIYFEIINGLFEAGAYPKLFQLTDTTLKKFPQEYDIKLASLVYSAFAKKRMNMKDEFIKDSLEIIEMDPLFFIERDSMKARGFRVFE